ncbi:MAG: acetoin utilization protein AcuC [Candidatus Freyarchaeota archaeon]|nr:acetoin utilization protein AcuC [Candidatus Jordarchaeia archaeon]
MGGKVALVYSDKYLEYFFGPEHPLRPQRLTLMMELIREIGLLDHPDLRVVEAMAASEEELKLVHSEAYLQHVKRLDEEGRGYLDYGDTPAFKGMFSASAMLVGGSLRAAELVMEGEAMHAFNPGGGMHHAARDRGAGFCVFNDVAITARYLQKKYNLKKIMIVDIDCHHGDGTQETFYSDPSVLTVSFHEDGRFLYPGTGFINEVGEREGKGYCVNVPLPPFTFTEAYLYAYNEVVPPLVKSYEPDIIIQQCGVDTHFGDPLTTEALTLDCYEKIIEILHNLVHEATDGKLILLGGGGYEVGCVAKAWTLMICKLLGVKPPEHTPPTWRELYARTALELGDAPRDPDAMYEREKPPLTYEKERVLEIVKETVKKLKETISKYAPLF